MWFTFRPMIHGWSTGIPSWLGRVGIHIPESGLADRICHSESALELAGSEALDGDGVIGVSTGITTSYFITTTRISRGARRFITGTISIVVERGGAELSTVPEEGPDLLAEIDKRLGDMPHPAVRAAYAQAPSAATTTADKPAAFRHAGALASVVAFTVVVAEDFTAAAVAGTGNPILVMFPLLCKSWRWRETKCSE